MKSIFPGGRLRQYWQIASNSVSVLSILSVIYFAGCASHTEAMNNPQSAPTPKTIEKSSLKDKEWKVDKGEDGKYWIYTPDGDKMLTLGINNVTPSAWNPRENTVYYDAVNNIFEGKFSRWEEFVCNLLRSNGFNTFGSWSDPRLKGEGLYMTPCLYVSGHAQSRCLDGLRPGFEDKVKKSIHEMQNNVYDLNSVLGVFLDNEMAWFGKSGWDNIPNYTLLEVAFEQPEDDAARKAALDFLKKQYVTPNAFATAWGVDLNDWNALDANILRKSVNDASRNDRIKFTEMAAEAFFEPACRIVREMLPGKLILGTRFAGISPEPTIRVAGKYCDVISFNNYQPSTNVNEDLFAKYWVWGGRPMMIGEFSWRSKENTSGNPNTGGAGSVVPTQAQRADNYTAYVTNIIKHPMIVGAHWFEFADQSPQGRFDGENSNYGVVDIHNRTYNELLDAMSATNEQAVQIHSNSDIAYYSEVPKPPDVTFEPGQHPERPPVLDLLSVKTVAPPGGFAADDAEIFLEKKDGKLHIKYNTGEQWGCGFTIFGPADYAVDGPDNSTDMDGYSAIVIEGTFPEKLSFTLILDEAGTDSPMAQSYDTRAGDDGESFTFPESTGTGKMNTYRYELKDLLPRDVWGNQQGKRKVDMNAIKGPALVFGAFQGSGEILINSFRLER
jgi:hypothetical protein